VSRALRRNHGSHLHPSRRVATIARCGRSIAGESEVPRSPAFVLYGATSVAHGSGFLAVLLGLVVGDARLPYKSAIEPFHESLAGLAELVVFLALGATVRLADPGTRDWIEGVARDGDALQPEPDLALRAGDRVLILADPGCAGDLRGTFSEG
jgi:NhaP-type Na+/H+ and K+/H+ antiporter